MFKYSPKCRAPGGSGTSAVLKCDGFSITVIQVGRNSLGLDEFAKRNLRESAAYTLIDEGSKSLSGKEVVYAIHFTGATNSTKTVKYAFIVGDAGYLVSSASPAKEFKRNLSAVETVVKTLKAAE